ncbi:MAG: rplY [Candidatus Saccharibacteria bacterium]|nr:rplY [Candidatus Saccharibacteria bacterium]
MQNISLKLEERTVVGKGIKELRRQGLVPAVIHDHGKESVVVMGPQISLLKAYGEAGKHHPLNLDVAGKKYLALIKETDFEPKKHQLRHLVFNAIKQNEKVEAEIPIEMQLDEGNEATPAERTGLIVLQAMEAIEVKALPNNLPDALKFNGEKLVEVGDHATVADLIVPEGVEIDSDPNQTIASVYEPSALQAANDAAGGDATDDTAATATDEEAVEGEEGETPAEGGAEPTTEASNSDKP